MFLIINFKQRYAKVRISARKYGTFFCFMFQMVRKKRSRKRESLFLLLDTQLKICTKMIY
uniref:Uncharacterized protein n=1 Tax=Bacteroides fragilis TaxID=817 RepID=A0A0I9SC76_BACFG